MKNNNFANEQKIENIKGEIAMKNTNTINNKEYKKAVAAAAEIIAGIEEWYAYDWGEQDWYMGVEADKQAKALSIKFGVSYRQAYDDIWAA